MSRASPRAPGPMQAAPRTIQRPTKPNATPMGRRHHERPGAARVRIATSLRGQRHATAQSPSSRIGLVRLRYRPRRWPGQTQGSGSGSRRQRTGPWSVRLTPTLRGALVDPHLARRATSHRHRPTRCGRSRLRGEQHEPTVRLGPWPSRRRRLGRGCPGSGATGANRRTQRQSTVAHTPVRAVEPTSRRRLHR